jgi:iron complex outermembrane recepter protein
MNATPARLPRRLFRSGVSLVFTLLFSTYVCAQQTPTGTIQGSVLNAATGRYVNNARVTVVGTNIETQTNENGSFWLSNVPAGSATVEVRFVGFEPKSAVVAVEAGSVTRQNFDLTTADGAVLLDPFSVEARALSGQAVAMTEERNAPNIKDVISLDEFVDMADGNLGEFLKYVPGVDIEYNPFYPTSAGIRGMPASGTVIQYDGVTLAAPSVAGNRTFDLTTAANANVERLEVSKVPTPDMPANAVGGSINVVSTGGFNRKDPLFTYSVYGTYSARRGEFDPTLDKLTGSDPMSDHRPVGLAYEFSYLLPLRNKYAFSVALTHTPRMQEAEFMGPNWALSATNPPVAANGLMSEYLSYQETDTLKLGFDWKIGQYGTLKTSWFSTQRDGQRRWNRLQWVTNAAGRTGNANETRGRGDVRQLQDWQQQHRELEATSIVYRHDGPVWKADASIAFSTGHYHNDDISDGHFAVLNAAAAANSIDWVATGIQGVFANPGRIPDLTATAVSGGAAINPFNGSNIAINTVTANDELSYLNDSRSVGLNVGREFDVRIPTTIKVGAYIEESSRDGISANQVFTFRPNGSSTVAARLATNFDVFLPDAYTNRHSMTTASGAEHHVRFISMKKLYDLYLQNPSWFVRNEAEEHITRVNGSEEITETITAGYIRMDNRFVNNRLKLTTGVRYEHTEDDGSGGLDDISATYRRNPNGTFQTDASGNFIPITTNALELAKLRYKERAAAKKTDYDGFYPSVNASFDLRENFVLRAGYAHTIGRPDLTRIIPSTTISDPDDINPGSGALGSIRIVDGNLQPWSANNYDLTLEAYEWKGATASVSLFQKDIENFFTTRDEDASPALLASLGLPQDFQGYRVVRDVNSGSATIRGVELSYRQSLSFLPWSWGRRIQVFGNLTNQNITGPNAGDFARVAENMFRGGVSYVDRRFVAKVNVTYEDFLLLGGAAGGAQTFLSPTTRWDFSTQFRVHKNVSLFFSVRNLTAEPQKRSVLNSNTINPEYSHPREWRYLPATYSFGVKGTF